MGIATEKSAIIKTFLQHFASYSDEKLLNTVYAIILKKLHANNSEERSETLKLIHNLPPLCRDWMKLPRFYQKTQKYVTQQSSQDIAEIKLRTNDFKNFCDVLINMKTADNDIKVGG